MFYKVSEGRLQSANAVYNKDYTLIKQDKDTYSYPLEGWYWFDSSLEATEFFGDQIKSEEELNAEEQPEGPEEQV